MAKIIITGASSGIGASIAEAFSQDGSHQLILIGRSKDRLEAVANATNGYPVVCDLTNEEQVVQACSTIQSEFQSAPDILVNNAGNFGPKIFRGTTPEHFRQQIESNLTVCFLITKQLLPAMVRSKSGHIFFMGGVASVKGYPGATAYCAAKHAVLGFARALRAETMNSGVRITTILPGATLTPSWDGTNLPEERFIPPEDVARSIIDAWKLSSRSVVEEILIRPAKGDL